jgi:hypothetical protein
MTSVNGTPVGWCRYARHTAVQEPPTEQCRLPLTHHQTRPDHFFLAFATQPSFQLPQAAGAYGRVELILESQIYFKIFPALKSRNYTEPGPFAEPPFCIPVC